MRNPFRPSFGQVPARMAGREQIVDNLTRALENGPGDPNLTTIIIGARGTGKTAFLTYMSSIAGERGWLSVDVVCREGMLDDILIQTRKTASHLLDGDTKAAVNAEVSTGLSIGAPDDGITLKKAPDSQSREGNWRLCMEELLDAIEEKNAGLLVTIDEVDPSLPDMIDFASTYQLFVRAERPVALLMAGLPHRVSQLLSDKSVSFLRRACQQHLRSIPDYEVEDAFRRTVEDGGKKIGAETLEIAAAAISGFPFMMQLVGYRSWEASGEHIELTASDARDGVKLARQDMEDRVLKTTLDELSDMGIRFLEAMVEDKTASTLSDVAQRLDKDSGYASNYKRRLLEAGVIEETGRGKMCFALPCLHEYVPRYVEAYL